MEEKMFPEGFRPRAPREDPLACVHDQGQGCGEVTPGGSRATVPWGVRLGGVNSAILPRPHPWCPPGPALSFRYVVALLYGRPAPGWPLATMFWKSRSHIFLPERLQT